MDLNALKLFVEAARAGSLSAAARRSGVPLPTLSRQLRKLEDELETRLLERGPKGVALTSAGHQLAADADAALAVLAEAESRLHDASGIAGRLRISMPPDLDPLWPLLRDFRRRHPAVSFDVFVTDRRVDLAADGVDVALRVGDARTAGYVGRTLARYRHRVVAAPTLLAGREPTDPTDLAALPCACWRGSSGRSWTLGGATVELEPILISNDYRHLLHLAEGGDAVVEVPPFLAAAGLQEGRLVEVLPAYPMPELALRALVVERRAMSPLVRSFLDDASEKVAAALGAERGAPVPG